MTIAVYKHKRGWLQYSIIVRGVDGEWHRERRKSPVKSEGGTLAYAKSREAWLLRNGHIEVVPDAPTIKDFGERWVKEHAEANRQKPGTIAWKRLMLKAHIERILGKDTLIDTIDAAAVQRVKAELSELAPKTVNNVLSVLSGMLRAAVKWGVIKHAPSVDQVKAHKRVMNYYDFEPYEKLVAGAAKVPDWRALAVVLLGGDAGLRRGEIIALERQDIDVRRRIATIKRSSYQGAVSAPKGGKTRHVDITRRLAEHLDAHMPKAGRIMGHITSHHIATWIRKAERAAELKETGLLHILRHTYGSHLAMAGVDIYRIKELMGHSNVTTTQIYAHLSPRALSDAVAMLEKARG